MLILLSKSQLALFDAPVHVAAHVRKDGTMVAPHTRIQKVALKQPGLFGDKPAKAEPTAAPKAKRSRLDAFIARHGGEKELGRTLSGLTEGQQQRLFAEMAKLDGITPAAVAERFSDLASAPEPTKVIRYIDADEHGEVPPIAVRAPESAPAPAPVAEPEKPKAKRARKPKAEKAPAPEPTPAPAPVAAPHDPAAPFGVAAGTSKARRREINAAAAALVERGGPYSADDLALLRQYSGNGGCGDSLNEYYTDPEVAAAMWEAIGRMGLTHGTALEPSCGTGVFLHKAPEGFRVTGVELDPVSSACALALHGDRHEIATASLERFATSDDRQFDVVIGNPPYGPRGFLSKDDKVGLTTAEAYFTDTALDKCKPGGVVALVVPTGIMDSSRHRALRERLLVKGQFLGALRMPNTAFEHAHTEVTTDVIFLRKRPDDVAGALGTVPQATLQALGVWDEDFLAGTYFTEGRGAGNVLGSMEDGWRARAGIGKDITVEGSMSGVPDAIRAFAPHPESAAPEALTVQQVLDALPDGAARDAALSASLRRPYDAPAKVGDTRIVNGVSYVLQGDPPRWHRVDEFMATTAVADAAPLAADIDRLMAGGDVDRAALASRIKAYVEKHGLPADNAELMTAAGVDRTLYRLIGAVNRKGELSDAVRGAAPRKVEGTLDSYAQSLALDERGEFTAAELADRLGRPTDEVEDHLAADSRYATLGDGRWTTMDVYLTGELWPKLDAARAALAAGGDLAEKLQQQVKRLEEVIDPRSLDDVDFQINSAFLPLHVLEAYFNWRQYDSDQANEWTRKRAPVSIAFADGVYTVKGGNEYGDTKLLDKYLNRTGVRKDDKPTIDAWNAEFKEWLCGSAYRDAVEELYNRSFRGFVAREFSDAPIEVPGLAADRGVRSWRWSSLRRSLAMGKGIVADDVGLGKTLGGLLLARMARLDGRAKRPIIVVPKSVLANWYAETQAWFPGSRVLTIGANFATGKDGELVGRDDSAAERKRKYHDLTQNDYDFILISEPAFEEVDLSPATKERYYSDDFWVQRGEALGNAGDKRRKRIREQYEQSLAAREFQDRTDAIWFDDLGVDMLIQDEMHHSKNLFAAKARFGDQPKFLGGQGLSNRALDFNLKCRLIREGNGGRGVFGLTATPTKNSPLEIYSMLSHIAPEAFERIGVRNSEEFLDRFCEFVGDKVLSTSGEIEDATVVSGFKNLTELREIMSRFIDRRTAEQVGLKLPERADHLHLVDMTPKQQEVYAGLRELAEESSKKDATGDAHIFSVMDRMNKAALDLALLGPEHAGAASPKYQAIAKTAKDGLKDGAQIIFSEYIDSHERIAAALADAGIPRARIGIINAKVAGSAVKRQNIAEALNNGKLDVVIGNATMAEGLNMQKRTTDIHHADVPWDPATLQQRVGRGLRQGNHNEAVRIHTYLSKGSFDGYRYQSVRAKKDWQDLLWNGGDRVDNLAREGNFSREDLRIMLAADPEAARKVYEADRAAAQQRYDAGRRVEANKEFVRFQEMTRSYGALKNKGTASAARLRQRLEAVRTSLFNSKHFPAKHALDSAADVLIEPASGTALHGGVGLDYGDEGRFVVSGVNARAGTVTMRRYADTTGGRPVTVPLEKLASGIKTFAFDAKEEASEVGRKLEAEAAGKLDGLTSMKDLEALPASVISANAEMLQRKIKEGAKSYTFRFPYGSVPMINRATDAVEMKESYEHTKLHDTHDYLLPTDDAKEKVIQAYIDTERAAAVGYDYLHAGKGRSQRSITRASKSYPGARYDAKTINPFRLLLASMGGARYGDAGPLVQEAEQRLKAEQMERIRRADSLQAILDGLLPLAQPEGQEGGKIARYPKDALTLAWARARRIGALDQAPQKGRHSAYAVGQGGAEYGRPARNAHAALMALAADAGHHDLAEAMAESGERHAPHASTPQALAVLSQHYTPSARRVRLMRRIAERHGLTDQTLGQLREHGLGGNLAAPSGYGYTDPARQGRTLGSQLDEMLAHAEARAQKEAA